MAQERPFSYHLRADFSPAACVVSGRRENLIDLGAQDIHGYGRVYIDAITFAELAEAMGFVDGENAKRELEGRRAEHKANIDTLQRQLEQVTAKNEELLRAASQLEKSPNKVALEEFKNGITDLVGRLADDLFSGGDGSPDLPVPAVIKDAHPSNNRAGGDDKRPVRGRGKAQLRAVERLAEKPLKLVEPVVDDSSGGDSDDAPGEPAVGGPELHEGFEWIESIPGDAGEDPAGDDQPGGD